ncbi:recombinase family protein [Maricaulis sp.]|uniref:recombinase family protein n=1 Tax=Maricaulis sp. TaxID=1486257 RepID=UPI000C492CF1|nr:recombinase family protein [Maricaulis sp.]MAC89373.1 DNA invertase [Maricaulis sp.]
MLLGYARTSTSDQTAGLEAQIEELTNSGADRIFQEQVSSVSRRDQLEAALDYLRDDDVLMVTKLDRLARSVADLMRVIECIKERNASLRILAMNLDTESATGKLMISILGSVAEFEREIMLERQREGISKAKAAGKYKGRAPTARQKTDQALELLASGMTQTAVAAELGISRSSVQRIVRRAAKEPSRQSRLDRLNAPLFQRTSVVHSCSQTY